ncbi:MAG: glycerol-3-phosphate O-acyltransferase [Myxococcota bacterium]|jgi:glycerol-3-phosphate O-acyltransferase
MRAEHKESVRSEVTARVVGRYCSEGQAAVQEIMTDALFHERTRLEKSRYPGEEKDVAFWKNAARTLGNSSPAGERELLQQTTLRFVNEVMGHFDPKVYRMSTKIMPTALGVLLNSLDPRRALKNPKLLNLNENIIIKGESEAARRMASLGTVVVVPTHLSNLDSIVMGYAAFLMGLPPLTYGAGLNLFNNRLIGYFMSNLGAYRVDRRKKCALYKEVLKEYATYSIELGYHNLFFPGGTRIRSGEVETKLKKGLLGTGLRAYMNNISAGRPKPNVYIVPCTISYALVLEAKTLIEDHLKEAGKSRYIISDDEFSRVKRIAEFMRELMALNSRIYLTFGQPLDPFGNRVDFQGRSIDARGREIDITRYVAKDGTVYEDPQRDRQYTTELSRSIVTSFTKDNRLQSTNIVAFTVFQMMRNEQPGSDLYRVLRSGHSPAGFPVGHVAAGVDAVLTELRAMVERNEIHLDPDLDGRDAASVLKHALRTFASYHHTRAVKREGERIHGAAPELVYYYHNRAAGYGLERLVGPAVAAVV